MQWSCTRMSLKCTEYPCDEIGELERERCDGCEGATNLIDESIVRKPNHSAKKPKKWCSTKIECKTEGCNKPSKSKGFCLTCYARYSYHERKAKKLAAKVKEEQQAMENHQGESHEEESPKIVEDPIDTVPINTEGMKGSLLFNESTDNKKEKTVLLKKICFICNKELPITEFYRDKKNNDGYYSSCKECVKEKKLKRKEENPHPDPNHPKNVLRRLYIERKQIDENIKTTKKYLKLLEGTVSNAD